MNAFFRQLLLTLLFPGPQIWSLNLVAANGSSIRTFGKRILPISFAKGHRVDHVFWIAEVSRPILGADFFTEHNLLIDLPHRQLVSRASGISFSTTPTNPPSISSLRLPTSGPYESLLESFPDLLVQNFKGEVRHKVKHFITTEGPPIHARPRRLDAEKLQVAESEFLKMKQMGIVRRSDSPWASPLHVVPKADGS